MAFSWAASIPITSASSIVTLKPFQGVRVIELDDLIWLSGKTASQKQWQEIDSALRKISGASRFDRLDDDQLILSGNTVPCSRLPLMFDEDWMLLVDWIKFRLPSASLVGQNSESVKVKIKRGSTQLANQSKHSSLLLCQIGDLVEWAQQASVHRIERLSFACNLNGSTVVRGEPLPPIRGKTFVEYENIAIETGYSWSPAVSIESLQTIFRLEKSQILICESDQPIKSIDHNDFVRATRAGIRATAVSFSNGQGASL